MSGWILPASGRAVSGLLILNDGIRKRSGWSNAMWCWSWEAMKQGFFFVTIFQAGSVNYNSNFPFHQDNHCFAVGPLNRIRKRQGEDMSAGRYDCAPTQCYHPDTVLLNIWRKSFCSISGCLLGCEAAVGRLTTWWAALKYTLRIKLFIQGGNMYPDCGEDLASCSSASPDSLLAHPASSHFMQTFHKSPNSLQTRLRLCKIEHSLPQSKWRLWELLAW